MKRPLAFFGFSSAITLLILNALYSVNRIIFILVAVVLFVASLLIKKLRQGRVAPIAFGAALFSCLVFSFVMSNTVSPQLELARSNSEVKATFHIVSEPEKTYSGYCYNIKTDRIEAQNAPQNIKLRLYTKNLLEADYYDRITANIRLKEVAAAPFEAYGSFGEDKYLTASCYGDYDVSKLSNKPVNYYIIHAREKLWKSLCANLNYDNAALSFAILTGNISYMSDEIVGCFRICGVSHIMAVSGLHTSILCAGLYFIIKKLTGSEYISVLTTVAASLFYIGLSDYSKSVIRACIMLFVLLASRLVNKRADSLNSLGLATALLCFNPFVVTDVSAVLTVTAVIGILTLMPMLDKGSMNALRRLFKGKLRRKHEKRIKPVVSSFNGTLSVVITTFPVVSYFFGYMSLLTFIVNTLIFFIIEFVVLFSLFTGILGFLPFVGFLLSTITDFLDKMLISTVKFFAEHFGFLYVDVSDGYYLIFCALVLLFVALSLIIFRRVKIKQVLAFSLVALVITASLSFYEHSVSKFVYISDRNMVSFYDKDTAVFVDVDTARDLTYAKSFLKSRSFSKIACIDCDIDEKNIEPLTDGEVQYFNNNDNFTVDLCDDISVKCSGNIIEVSLSDRVFSVSENKINVDDVCLIRNKDKRFSDYRAVTLNFKEGSELQLRRN